MECRAYSKITYLCFTLNINIKLNPMSKKEKFNRANDRVVNEHFQTKEYHKFRLTAVNREINPNKVKRLANSMSKIGFINEPIKVNEVGEIIDGQHRWLAAQKVGVPILYYIDRSPMPLFENMVATNSNGSPWTKQNSIHGLASKYPDYLRLEKFQAEFPEFTLTEQIMFMNNSFTGINKNKFERGEWKHKDLNIARQWATGLMGIKPYFPKGYNKSLFVRAMIDTLSKHPSFKLDEFIRKVQLRPGSIFLCGDVPSYKVMIESIYNYRRNNAEKINLRF